MENYYGIYCKASMPDVHVSEIRGVQYIVFSFFDSDEALKDRFGSMIQNAFEATNAPNITKESLVDTGIAIQDE